MESVKSRIKSGISQRVTKDKKIVLGPGEDELVHGAATASIAYVLSRIFGISGEVSGKIAAFSLRSGLVTRSLLKDRVIRK